MNLRLSTRSVMSGLATVFFFAAALYFFYLWIAAGFPTTSQSYGPYNNSVTIFPFLIIAIPCSLIALFLAFDFYAHTVHLEKPKKTKQKISEISIIELLKGIFLDMIFWLLLLLLAFSAFYFAFSASNA